MENEMNISLEEVLSRVDHTLLKQTATWNEIKVILDDAMEYGAASACIPPCYVKRAREYVGDRLKICTVIGFPNGNTTTASKVFEAIDAVRAGADEIDMVINVSFAKERDMLSLEGEISAVKAACSGKLLKVIIECCLLTNEEKIFCAKAVTNAGADYIKTSTGFSTGGATIEDVMLLRKHVGEEVKVKAAGGMSNAQDGADFIKAGADRLGSSRIIGSLKG